VQSLGLVFVAVYQNTLKLMYVDKLLARVKELFSKEFSPKKYEYHMFEAQFKRELEKSEQRAESRQRPQQSVQGNLAQRKVACPLPRVFIHHIEVDLGGEEDGTSANYPMQYNTLFSVSANLISTNSYPILPHSVDWWVISYFLGSTIADDYWLSHITQSYSGSHDTTNTISTVLHRAGGA